MLIFKDLDDLLQHLKRQQDYADAASKNPDIRAKDRAFNNGRRSGLEDAVECVEDYIKGLEGQK